MAKQSLNKEISAARAAVLAAGKYLKTQFAKKKEITLVGSHEKIADDQIAEDLILEVLGEKLGSFFYLSEESAQRNPEGIEFIIDPIEGTSNYLRGVPFFATQIAITDAGKVQAAFIYEPLKDILYEAIKGKGAVANNTSITVSKKTTLNTCLFNGGAGSGSTYKEWLASNIQVFAPKTRSIRLYGATGLELAYLASGQLNFHINKGSKPYDYAPGALIVQEAGGVVTNFENQTWQLSDTALCAANEKLHQEVLELTNK